MFHLAASPLPPTLLPLSHFRSAHLIHFNQTPRTLLFQCVPDAHVHQPLVKGQSYLQRRNAFLVFHMSRYRWRPKLHQSNTRHQKANHFISRSNFEYFGASLLTRGLPLLAAANIASRDVPVVAGTLFRELLPSSSLASASSMSLSGEF